MRLLKCKSCETIVLINCLLLWAIFEYCIEERDSQVIIENFSESYYGI
jgi:hypothetical protein